jgi:hypothetical protein
MSIRCFVTGWQETCIYYCAQYDISIRILNSRQNNVDPDHGGICRHGILTISDLRMNH